VRPTQPVEIFGNFSSPFGTLAIHWHPLVCSLLLSLVWFLSKINIKCKCTPSNA